MSRVMVVEDEVIVAADIAQSLESMGHTVTGTASSAAECFESAERELPDLVLMDIHIDGDTDGIQAAARLREQFDLPVLYLTAYADSETLSRAKLTNPLGYIVKPFRKNELKIAVELSLFRHQMERRVQARERWLRTTLHAIGEGVIAVDGDGRVEFLSSAAADMLGTSQEQAHGRPLLDVFQPCDKTGRRQLGAELREALQRREALDLAGDALLVTNGREILIECRVAPIIESDEQDLGSVIVFKDVTEKRREQDRATRTERLASLGTLAAGVGHEINNPLTYVLGNTSLAQFEVQAIEELLAEGAFDPALGDKLGSHCRILRSLLGEVEEGADRIRQVVRDLRGFTKSGNGDACDVNVAVRWALRVTSSLIATKGRVKAELGELPTVVGDETRLGQVFLNLIVNAVQAMAPAEIDRNELFIATVAQEDTAVVTIRDTGSGIDPDELKHIFEPFFTTKTHNGGTGLGLYVCHTILQQLGARLEVESELGKGSTFRVTLPLHQQPKRRPSSLPSPPLRILLVDSQPVVARALERTLGESHQVVSIGASGALQALREQRFALVVCELSESGRAGETLYRDIARDFPALARDLVFVTGSNPSADVQGFVAGLENTTVRYPLDSEAVEKIVRGRPHS